MPERSFHFNGMKFPVCARCTGVLAGSIAAYVAFLFYALPMSFCFVGCAVMFADWFVQRLGIWESTNGRRLVTGMLGGYSLSTVYCTAIQYAARYIAERYF